jgi:RHS repeat-associated protein
LPPRRKRRRPVTCDANDRFTAGDTYDNDGNTVSSGGIANTYDFENHLIQKGGVSTVYDGDGNRVSKTVAGVTTTYLVDTLNPTGYAQVVYEVLSGSSAPNRELNHIYVYGLELLGQTRNYVASSQSNTQQIYYDYDGHGSVRALTDPNANVTDTYDYDAFGNLIHSTGSTPNNYLFAGEQFDSDLGLYYNRARYLNVTTGRFWSMDPQDGDDQSPMSLHRYSYAGAEPVDNRDPTGLEGLTDTLTVAAIQTQLFVMAHPILTAVSTAVLISLAPEDFAQALPPGFGDELQVFNAVQTEVTQLTTIERLLNSNWLQKLRAGTQFESWMVNKILAATPPEEKQFVVKDGAAVLNNARVKGSAVIDAIFKGILTEFKTSFGAVEKYQAQQFAKYAQNGLKQLEYVFLYKPSPEEVARLQSWVREAGQDVKLTVTYILEK